MHILQQLHNLWVVYGKDGKRKPDRLKPPIVVAAEIGSVAWCDRGHDADDVEDGERAGDEQSGVGSIDSYQ